MRTIPAWLIAALERDARNRAESRRHIYLVAVPVARCAPETKEPRS